MIFRRRTVRIEVEQKTLRVQASALHAVVLCPHCGTPLAGAPVAPAAQPMPKAVAPLALSGGTPASLTAFHTCPVSIEGVTK